MYKKIFTLICLTLCIVGVGIWGSQKVRAEVNAVTPSTNELNKTKGWAHVDQISKGVGTTDLQFTSTRSFWSCFEYRSDSEPNTVVGANPNPAVTDGRWTQVCVNNSQTTRTISAIEYVDVRMVYGAETDERFDWTRFDVLPFPRSAEITSPTAGQLVSGNVTFSAYLVDDDVDAIQWAVRKGTCAAGTNTVFGNVDGKTDVATIDTSDVNNQTFSFTGDMSEMEPGEYCFIYNPVEDAGESNIRLTMNFTLEEPEVVLPVVPTHKDMCKNNGWKMYTDVKFKNQGDCVSWVQSSQKAVGNRKDN